MKVYRFQQTDPPKTLGVLTIGNFDGVHLGHQALVSTVVEKAKNMGSGSALVTFHPHPQQVLGNRPVPQLTSLEQRLEIFESLGLDQVTVVPFTKDLASMSAEAFVDEFLLPHFQLRTLVIGYDFAFGKNRAGTADVLSALSKRHGFEFEVFPPVEQNEEIVSSTTIREALKNGDFSMASRLLGRPWGVRGLVAHGPQLGRTLGFPTLNLIPSFLLPLSYGVYASRVRWQGKLYDGVSNYGIKPTVGTETPLLETHLFDFHKEIYGETHEVFPLARLRKEQKFPSLDALKNQIAKDSEQAKAFLAEN